MKNKTKWVIIAIIVISIVIKIVPSKSEEQAQQSEGNNSAQEQSMQEKVEHITLSGIENNKDSKTYGELVVSEINIWENPGPNRGRVVGKIPHNTKVKLLEEKTTDQPYYHVKGPNNIKGWVSELFVLEKQSSSQEVQKLTHTELLNLSKNNNSEVIDNKYLMTLYLEQRPSSTQAEFMTLEDENNLENIIITCNMSSSDLNQLDRESAQKRIHKPYEVNLTPTKYDKGLLYYTADCTLK